MQIGDNLFTAIGLFCTCGLMLLALFATWPSVIAYQKGRNFTKWYIFSILLFPVALLAAFLIKKKTTVMESK
jgi:cytochrome bd-type quinol oxidase subunit 2